MPTNQNDVIRGPYRAAVDALAGDDLLYWTHTSGNATLRGGSTGEHYDTNPYNAGNPGGDRLYLTGTQGMNVKLLTTESGTATVAGRTLSFSGIERVHGSDGNDTISAAGAKLAAAHDGTPTHGVSFYGGGGHDVLTGSAYADVLDGGTGNDTIRAGSGDDFVQSSTGNDVIYGDAGNENIRWGLGNNVAAGNDTIYGGETGEGIGDLINIWGVNGDFRTGVRVGFDTAESGHATSTMGGVTSTLRFYEFENAWSHEGNDFVSAASANVALNARGIHFNTRWGNDVLMGSNGSDTLEGGAGSDTITGGRGNDLISANADYYNMRAPGDDVRDTLVFARGDGADTVLGFDTGIDVLQLGGRSYHATEVAGGTLLDLGGGDRILLSDVFDFI